MTYPNNNYKSQEIKALFYIALLNFYFLWPEGLPCFPLLPPPSYDKALLVLHCASFSRRTEDA